MQRYSEIYNLSIHTCINLNPKPIPIASVIIGIVMLQSYIYFCNSCIHGPHILSKYFNFPFYLSGRACPAVIRLQSHKLPPWIFPSVNQTQCRSCYCLQQHGAWRQHANSEHVFTLFAFFDIDLWSNYLTVNKSILLKHYGKLPFWSEWTWDYFSR